MGLRNSGGRQQEPAKKPHVRLSASPDLFIPAYDPGLSAPADNPRDKISRRSFRRMLR
jgi:hypothetical protein